MNLRPLKLVSALAFTVMLSPTAYAFSVVSYWNGGGYQYQLTADGGTIYRAAYNSSTIDKYDSVGNYLGNFTAGSSRSLGAAGGKMVTKNGASLSLWDLNTEMLITNVTTSNNSNHGLAYDPNSNKAYFGTGSGGVYTYDFDDGSNVYLGNLGNADGQGSSYFEDLEIAGGFLWVIDGTDSDILKYNLDGSYVGKETTNAGLHIEGFGYDETTASFWGHSDYTPDFGANNGTSGYYVQELAGFNQIAPPQPVPPPLALVPAPAPLALIALGLIGLGVRRRQ